MKKLTDINRYLQLDLEKVSAVYRDGSWLNIVVDGRDLSIDCGTKTKAAEWHNEIRAALEINDKGSAE